MSDGGGGAAEAKAVTVPPRPTIFESLLGGAADVSPGPTTLVSSFLNDDPDGGCPTFSQHLTGVMASPVSAAQQRRPPSSVVSRRESMSPFSVLPPAIFSPNSGPDGISHQQSLAQATSQDAQSHSQMHILPDAGTNSFESGSTSHCNRRSQPASLVIDKTVDDGYNWRKYGQKQVKGGAYPRSYYKCTHPNCPVTKKVERSLEGQVTEIIYKGQHNHQKPPTNRRSKESNELNGNLDCATNADTSSKRKSEFGHGTSEQLPGSSDDEEGDADSEPEPKKTAVDVREMEPTSSHRTVTEPRIIVQTRSEVDLLDDGFRWRKYGQKVVKGNPHPRSYYRCTSAGCHVRKHVERASTDPKEVITAYEGKHNHETPAARNSSHNTANSIAAAHIMQPKVHSPIPSHQSFFERGDLTNNVHWPVAVLQLKEHSMP